MSRQQSRDVTRKLAMVVGIAIAVVLVIGGLAVVGAYVFIIIAMSNFGSNK